MRRHLVDLPQYWLPRALTASSNSTRKIHRGHFNLSVKFVADRREMISVYLESSSQLWLVVSRHSVGLALSLPVHGTWHDPFSKVTAWDPLVRRPGLWEDVLLRVLSSISEN